MYGRLSGKPGVCMATLGPGATNLITGVANANMDHAPLVAIIGLFDLLGTAQAALADPNWLGLRNEVYVFTGIVFWIFCFAMSRYSMRLEQQLGVDR